VPRHILWPLSTSLFEHFVLFVWSPFLELRHAISGARKPGPVQTHGSDLDNAAIAGEAQTPMDTVYSNSCSSTIS